MNSAALSKARWGAWLPGIALGFGLICVIWQWPMIAGMWHLLGNGLAMSGSWLLIVLLLVFVGVCFAGKYPKVQGLAVSAGIVASVGLASSHFERVRADRCLGVSANPSVYIGARAVFNQVRGHCNAPVVVALRQFKPKNLSEFQSLVSRFPGIGGQALIYTTDVATCHRLLSALKGLSQMEKQRVILDGTPINRGACGWGKENGFLLKPLNSNALM